MRWYLWVLSSLLTGVLGLFLAGFLAALLVDWYRVSSFEGASGFFVVFIALFGGLVGLVIGLIAAFVAARRPRPGLLKALAYGWGASLAIALTIGGVARVMADIPPTLDGEPLFLQIELRWPPGSPRPVKEPGAVTSLHSAVLSSVRKSVDGPLWLEDARQEDGRWIVPGVVEIFTQRGRRLIDLRAGDRQIAGFSVPLPGHPRAEHQRWSDWLPNYQPGMAPEGGGFTYRFRVARQSEPVRTLAVGPFEVAVIASSFYRLTPDVKVGPAGDQVNVPGEMAAWSLLQVAHRGQPVAGAERADFVGVVGGEVPALFVRATREDGYSYCRFLVSAGERLEEIDLGHCLQVEDVAPLTSDVTAFTRAGNTKALAGYPDWVTFRAPGVYLVGDLIVDTRTRTARRFTRPTDPYPVSSVPPLAFSPDERAFVLLGKDHTDRYSLVVVVPEEERSYTLPIDRMRQRFSSESVVDPAWVHHHFAWVRDASGHDTLQPRPGVQPLPFKGEFSDEPYAVSYSIGPGKDPLRDAIYSILTSDLGAEPMPDSNYGFNKRVRLDGTVIEISVIETGPYVYVSYEGGSGDAAFMRSVAARLDAAFATGTWDTAFEEN